MEKIKLTKQSDIVGKPFTVLKTTVLPTWVSWDPTAKRTKLGRFNRENKFQVYSLDVKTWVDTQYNREDGWRKQFMREILLSEEHEFVDVWGLDTKAVGTYRTRIVRVPISGGVEKQVSEHLENEQRRGNNPRHSYVVLDMKSTGPTAMEVEYTIKYSAPMAEEDKVLIPAEDAQKELSAPTPAPALTEEDKIKEIVDQVMFSFGKQILDNYAENYKATLVNQIKTLMVSKGVTGTSAEEIFDAQFMKKE